MTNLLLDEYIEHLKLAGAVPGYSYISLQPELPAEKYPMKHHCSIVCSPRLNKENFPIKIILGLSGKEQDALNKKTVRVLSLDSLGETIGNPEEHELDISPYELPETAEQSELSMMVDKETNRRGVQMTREELLKGLQKDREIYQQLRDGILSMLKTQ